MKIGVGDLIKYIELANQHEKYKLLRKFFMCYDWRYKYNKDEILSALNEISIDESLFSRSGFKEISKIK